MSVASERSTVERLLLEPVGHVVEPHVQERHVAALRAAVEGQPVMDRPSADEEPAAGRGRARVVVVTAAALIAMTGAGLAAAAVARTSPTDVSVVRCFAVATTDFDSVDLAQDVGAAAAGDAGPTSASVARDLCAAVWSQGGLSSDAPHVRAGDPAAAPSPVPPLDACVLPDGRVGVFPGAQGTCEALRLPVSDQG